MNIAPSQPRPRRGRQPLTQILIGAAYVLCQLENGFMRCLAIRRGVHHRAAGEHMPVRLPDAGSSTAWAVRPLDAAADRDERQRENAP